MASGRSGPLSWRIDAEQGCTTVALTGELDLAVVNDLRAVLVDALTGSSGVVIDLQALSFMDSTGLRLMIELKHRVEGAGGTLVLRNIGDAVMRVLDVTGMTAFFEQPLSAAAKPALKAKIG